MWPRLATHVCLGWVKTAVKPATVFQLDHNESSKEERPRPTSARDRRFCEAERCGSRHVTSALCCIRLLITPEDSFQNKSVSRCFSSLFSSDRTCARRRPHHVSRGVHAALRGAARCAAVGVPRPLAPLCAAGYCAPGKAQRGRRPKPEGR